MNNVSDNLHFLAFHPSTYVIFGGKGNCTTGNRSSHPSAWLYYVLAMLYDLVVLSISTVFLFKVDTRDQRFSRLIKM